jgi:uncharacterized protein YlxP (DUF503 family)
MVVGAALVEIHVQDSQSLKQKRGVVRSIQQRLRNKFNISVSEVGGQATWQRAVLGITAAGAEAPPVKKVLENAIRFVEQQHTAEVLNSDLELMVLPHEATLAELDWEDEDRDEEQDEDQDDEEDASLDEG